jgi:hypothetical protein
MKNKWFVGIGVLLVFAFLGCVSSPPVTFETITLDSSPTVFEGIWIHLGLQSQNAKITFIGNSFKYQWTNGNINGRFAYDGKKIVFCTDDGKKWSTSYTLKDGELSLAQGNGCWHVYGTFAVIDANQNIQLDGSWKHPNPQAQGATYTFTGNQFVYTRNDGFNASGDFDFMENKLTIKVSGNIVKEYMCHFQNNGSRLYLGIISGDGNYYQGPFDKQ